MKCVFVVHEKLIISKAHFYDSRVLNYFLMIFIHVVCLPGSIHCVLGVGPLAPLGPPESALLPLDWCPIRDKIIMELLNSGLYFHVDMRI